MVQEGEKGRFTLLSYWLLWNTWLGQTLCVERAGVQAEPSRGFALQKISKNDLNFTMRFSYWLTTVTMFSLQLRLSMRQTMGTIFGDNMIRDLLLHYLLNLYLTSVLAVYVMQAWARRSYILIFEINCWLRYFHTVLRKTMRKCFLPFIRVIETFVNWKKLLK